MPGRTDQHFELGARATSRSLTKGRLWPDLRPLAALLGVVIGWVLAVAAGVVILVAELAIRP
ncbi:MAG TPA: hypothetical protein VJR05_01125 [Acidimicrobiia bacterium]|nr:hypothetical protein [Acidimicrobiia bacterium]